MNTRPLYTSCYVVTYDCNVIYVCAYVRRRWIIDSRSAVNLGSPVARGWQRRRPPNGGLGLSLNSTITITITITFYSVPFQPSHVCLTLILITLNLISHHRSAVPLLCGRINPQKETAFVSKEVLVFDYVVGNRAYGLANAAAATPTLLIFIFLLVVVWTTPLLVSATEEGEVGRTSERF
ncbi:hypothetical protein F4776DRAFT_619551 [Hypoxylon sp. NC0597]|nr:hypothetical protein F4776DRAFT_619551 [Hypoxylon sp. NC0597]